ncbi:hypothetical protein N9L68_06810 [bacterium]|nr:hypothetical protein [bacterium]
MSMLIAWLLAWLPAFPPACLRGCLIAACSLDPCFPVPADAMMILVIDNIAVPIAMGDCEYDHPDDYGCGFVFCLMRMIRPLIMVAYGFDFPKYTIVLMVMRMRMLIPHVHCLLNVQHGCQVACVPARLPPAGLRACQIVGCSVVYCRMFSCACGCHEGSEYDRDLGCDCACGGDKVVDCGCG